MYRILWSDPDGSIEQVALGRTLREAILIHEEMSSAYDQPGGYFMVMNEQGDVIL